MGALVLFGLHYSEKGGGKRHEREERLTELTYHVA